MQQLKENLRQRRTTNIFKPKKSKRERKKKEFGEISFRSYKKTCQIVLNLFETGSLYYMLVQGFRVYWFIHWSIQ